MSGCRRGSVALEFALALPVLITFVMGLWDASHALLLWRQVDTAAVSVATGATTLAIHPDGTASLAPGDAQAAMSAVFGTMPGLRAGTDRGQFAVTLTGVVFAPSAGGCGAGGCAPVANTAWSVALTLGGAGAQTRGCGRLVQVAPDAPRTLGNIPTAGIVNLTSVVLADVQYRFTPMFVGFITGSIGMWRSSLVVPRVGGTAQYVTYDPAAGASDPAVCAGYL